MNNFKRMRSLYGAKTGKLQIVFRWLLGLSLLYAGIAHLSFARQEFIAQVPNWVPMNADWVVLLSGVAEIIIGIALLALPAWKALIGWVAAIFFVFIFPGNIAQYLNQIDAFGLNSDQARLIRLFFQPVLVVWALWSTAAWKSLKSMNNS